MAREVFQQLAELAESFNQIGLKPVICGALGIYLCFHQSEDEARRMIRTTNDIDLLLTETQLLDKSRRNAIADIITGKLHYVVCEHGRHFRFKKRPDQRLDILVPPIEKFETKGFRTTLVKSKLHGHITDEARFIEEDLRTISLSGLLPGNKVENPEVGVPSPTNLLIFKLFAFDDRDAGQREDRKRAQAHTWDIYIAVTLASRNDYQEGQEFLSRHRDSEIIRRAQSIVRNKFSTVERPGWRHVLEASDFYPELSRREKESKLEIAGRRLIRWFNISAL